LNVCPLKGCNECPKPIKGLGYNNCYNDKALVYTNNLRKVVGQPKVILDTEISAKAQKWAKEFNDRGAEASENKPETCF
jgi:hypothetical protein